MAYTVVIYASYAGPFANGALNGKVYLEGPHYPEPHRWYAVGIAQDGRLISLARERSPVDKFTNTWRIPNDP